MFPTVCGTQHAHERNWSVAGMAEADPNWPSHPGFAFFFLHLRIPTILSLVGGGEEEEVQWWPSPSILSPGVPVYPPGLQASLWPLCSWASDQTPIFALAPTSLQNSAKCPLQTASDSAGHSVLSLPDHPLHILTELCFLAFASTWAGI